MIFEAKRSFLLRNGSFILRSTKFGICLKQAAKGFKSQSNYVAQRKLLNSSRPFAAFYNSKRYFFQSFCRWQSQFDAEANSDANASSVMAENVKNKRLVDLFESLGSLKCDRQKISKELNFPDDLLDELIAHTALYINKDDIDKVCYFLFCMSSKRSSAGTLRAEIGAKKSIEKFRNHFTPKSFAVRKIPIDALSSALGRSF